MKRESELHRLQSQYEGFILATTSRATAIRYAKALEAFFSKFSERRSPDEFSRADIQDYQLYRRKDGVSNLTINYEIGRVKAFWQWLMDRDFIPYNPAETVRRLKVTETERNSLGEAEQLRIYQTAEAMSAQDALLVTLALSTGLRGATLVQLEKSDVDFEAGVLRISGAKMKARRNHDVPLRAELMARLSPLPDGRLFNGYATDAKALSYKFNRIVARAGFDLRGLRVARRTFATTLLRTGADLGLVQGLLGHKNISTTSRYLVPADQAQTREAINRLPTPGLTPPEAS